MGIGDEVMVTGEVRRLQERDPRPVLVIKPNGTPRWHPVWEGNARFAQRDGPGIQRLVNAGGARPYLDYAASVPNRWVYTDWRATPGELPWVRFNPRDQGQILIEPNIKAKASPNKDWGWERWQRLVDLDHTMPWLQIGPPGTRWLEGVARKETTSFRDACCTVAGMFAAVLPEGALHHAAAALGVPAVVLFGAYISPRTTGYDLHRNIAVDDPQGLGWRIPHPACAAAWQTITPEQVLGELEELIRARKRETARRRLASRR